MNLELRNSGKEADGLIEMGNSGKLEQTRHSELPRSGPFPEFLSFRFITFWSYFSESKVSRLSQSAASVSNAAAAR
jgi:hypothetical protein